MPVRAQELKVLSLSHLYSLKTKIYQCHYVVMTRSLLRNDIMRFLVLGIRSDIWIELQVPVVRATVLIKRMGRFYQVCVPCIWRCYRSNTSKMATILETVNQEIFP